MLSIVPSIRSSIAGTFAGAGRPPSLGLYFDRNAYSMGAIGSFPTSRAFSDLITFTRASGGGIINSLGQFEWVGTNVPRLTYDPVTLQPLGLLVEEQRTNLVLQSAALATQNVTVTAVAHTLSFYGTGTVTLSGAATGSKVGSGAYPSRSELTFTPTAGTLTLTITGSVTFGQLEVGSSASSYIPTTTAQVTRASDVPTVNTLSPWYNATEGTIVVRAIKNGQAASTCSVVSLDNGATGNDRIQLRQTPATNAASMVVLAAGETQANIVTSTNSWPVNTAVKSAMSYANNNFAVSVAGGSPTIDTSGSVPTVSRMVIASPPGYLPGFNGTIASIEYYPRVIDVQQASA